jgi:hypothetical protein
MPSHTLWAVYKEEEIYHHHHMLQIVTVDIVLVRDLLFIWVICYQQRILLGYPPTGLDGHSFYLQMSHISWEMV